jgi:hypothetical protein
MATHVQSVKQCPCGGTVIVIYTRDENNQNIAVIETPCNGPNHGK